MLLRGRLTRVMILFGCIGCEPSKELPALDAEKAIGVVEWAIGPAQGKTPFSQVQCKVTPEGTQIRLEGTQTLQGADFSARPDVLIAHFPAENRSNAKSPDYGTSVFLPNLELDGRTYPMIQLVAQAMPGVPPEVSCELQGAEPLVLACRHARVMPWLSPTPIPEGSFRAKFECP